MQNQRLVELLVQRAVDGLNSAERAELKQLLAEENYVDAGRFEYTAAALLLAGNVEDEALPEDLQDRLLIQAQSFESSLDTSSFKAPPPASPRQQVISIVGRSRQAASTPAQAAKQQQTVAPRRTSNVAWQGKVGWFAAAASVLIAVAGWWPRLQSGGADVEPPVVASLEQQREALLAQQGTLRRTWQTTQDAAASGVTGDVVWDPQKQQGFVRFRGLQANNAQEMQYQLWIFDGTRDDKYPIDGGVFDIPAGSKGEVIIPINAKLHVNQAAMFAVTIEKPGGSVVSTRDRIVVLAKA